MKKKLQIFVSSTYTDLIDERQGAVETILKSGHIPAGMELFTAGDVSQMETINRWIEESDIYMLILGGRYGSVEKKTSLSYTELEYDYAVSIGKPVFAVVIKEDALDARVKEKGKEVLETEHPQEYKAFREKVLSRTSAFFEDTKDVKLAVHESIPDLEASYELTGWVSGVDVPDTRPLLAEIKRLLDQNAELMQENENLKKRLEESAKTGADKESFDDLIELLEQIKIESEFFDTTGQNKKPERVSLLTIFYIMRDALVTGVTNQVGIDDLQRLLYFNVCPKLQIHGLMINEKVPSVRYRRFSLTKKGIQLLAYFERKQLVVETEKKDEAKKARRGGISKKTSREKPIPTNG